MIVDSEQKIKTADRLKGASVTEDASIHPLPVTFHKGVQSPAWGPQAVLSTRSCMGQN